MGLTGREVAERMLSDYGIRSVKVISTKGQLTDHYNPEAQTINLSESVYASNSIIAVAVAAHETGHALQHATNYGWLNLRTGLVTIVKPASVISQILLGLGGLMIMYSPTLLTIGVIALAITTLFAFVTLPVEFDASRRALLWLTDSGLMREQGEQQAAKEALDAAAMTYVAGAVSSLLSLIYYVILLMNNSSRRD